MSNCNNCGVELTIENTFKKGNRRSYNCKSCQYEYVKNRWKRLRRELVDSMGGKCVVCGYNNYIGALHMHHLEQQDKDFQWRELRKQSKKTIQEEIKKCVLLCANCHAEVHAGITEL